MDKLHGVTIIGRKHTNKNGQHQCITPTLYANGKLFYEISPTKGLFVNATDWFWKPAEGFYGIFNIRSVESSLTDFFDYTTFDEELTSHVYYLAGA